MRFFRIQGLLTAAALLAVLPAHGQNATSPTTAPTMTPPGGTTSVPLLPDTSTTTPGALPGSNFPTGTLPGANVPPAGLSMPSTGLSMPSMYSGLGGLGGGSDLTSILAGSSSTPLTLILSQLDSHWRRLTVSGNLDLGSITAVLSSVMGSAGLGVYYTKGETVSVGDATYLVAYRAQPTSLAHLADAMSGMGMAAKPPAPEKLTPATPLSLSLLNLQTVGSLTDIRPFNLTQELADSAAAAHAYNSMMSAMTAAAMSMATTMPHVAAPNVK